MMEHSQSLLCILQMSDYGDLSYLTEAKYEQQLVDLSQSAELVSVPIGTRGFTAGKVSHANSQSKA